MLRFWRVKTCILHLFCSWTIFIHAFNLCKLLFKFSHLHEYPKRNFIYNGMQSVLSTSIRTSKWKINWSVIEKRSRCLNLPKYWKLLPKHNQRTNQYIASTLVFLVNDMWQMKSTSQKYESGEWIIFLSWSSFSWGRIPILVPQGCNHQPFHIGRAGWKSPPEDDQSKTVPPNQARSWRDVGGPCISSQTSLTFSCSVQLLQPQSVNTELQLKRQWTGHSRNLQLNFHQCNYDLEHQRLEGTILEQYYTKH